MKHYGFIPRRWQLRVYEEIREGKKDVVVIAGTGSGKTLTFALPMIEQQVKGAPGLFFVFSPLTQLMKDQVCMISNIATNQKLTYLLCQGYGI